MVSNMVMCDHMLFFYVVNIVIIYDYIGEQYEHSKQGFVSSDQ